MIKKHISAFRDKYLAVVFAAALLLVSAIAQSQVYQSYPPFGAEFKRIQSLLTFNPPYGATNTLNGGKTVPGALFYNTTDSSYHVWTGTQFLKVAKSADALNISNLGSAFRIYAPHLSGAKTISINNGLTGDTATSGQIGIKLGGPLSASTEINAATNDFRIMDVGRFLVRTTTNTRPLILSASNGTDSAVVNINRTSSTSMNASLSARTSAGNPAGMSSSITAVATATGGSVSMSVAGNTSREGRSSIDTFQIRHVVQQANNLYSRIQIYYDSITIDNGAGNYFMRNVPRFADAATERVLRIDTVTGKIGYYPNTGTGGATSTIYTDDGTLQEDRRVNANNYPLTFDSSGLFRIRDTSAHATTGKLYGHIYDFNDGVDFYDYDSTLNVRYTQNSLSGFKMQVTDRNDLDTNKLLQFNEQGLKLQDGTQGNNKVLTSNAAGLASWQTSSAPGLQAVLTQDPVLTTSHNITHAGLEISGTSDLELQSNTIMTLLGAGAEVRLRDSIEVDWSGSTSKVLNLGANLAKNQLANDSMLTYNPGTGRASYKAIPTANVTKVGTPVNNQLGIWTGNGTIEGDPLTTWNGTKMLFGDLVSGATATPVNLSLGSSYANTAGDPAKAKLKFYDDGTNVYGFGISSGAFEFHASTGANYRYYIATTERFTVASTGNVGIGDASPASLLTVGSSDAFQVNSSGKVARYGASAITDGQILIGHTSNGTFEKATLTGSSSVTVANGAGSITLSIPITHITSGTYNPTATTVTSVTSVTTNANTTYTRTGDMVTVTGSVLVNPAAEFVNSEFALSLPIASAFTASTEGSGLGSIESQTTNNSSVVISMDATNDRASFRFHAPMDGSSVLLTFTFTYKVTPP